LVLIFVKTKMLNVNSRTMTRKQWSNSENKNEQKKEKKKET